MRMKTKDPSKQRKMLFNAPPHLRGKIMSVHLSEDLRETYGIRSLPVRSGDTVRVLRGDYKDYEGRVTRVDRKKYRIHIEGVAREKADGTTAPVPIHYSKVEIVRLNLDDEWRKRILERKGAPEAEESTEKITEEEKEGLQEESENKE
jgi:large subunit ribosomal protein L24